MEAPISGKDRFTYADYEKLPENERWELIEGRPYAMTPAPLVQHQRISRELLAVLTPYFSGKSCEVFHAPLDVRLPERNEKDEEVDTVVEPDLMVVCDPAKVDEKGVRGAPDLLIKILSESTVQRDMDVKLRLYEKHGVRGYIIADPWGKTLTVRYLETPGRFGRPELFAGDDRMPVRLFEGLEFEIVRIFANL